MATKYDTSWYDQQEKLYNANADKNATAQKQDAETAYKAKLKEAYITQMQNKRALNDSMSLQGIRGGASETSMLNIQNQYGNDRNNAFTNYNQSVRDIDRENEANKLSYKMNNESARQEYIQNRGAEDRANAREDKVNNRQIKIERWTNAYAKSYDVNALKKALAKATDPDQKSVINARIAYITAHKKKY